jgi:ABC-type sulfate/molybdate transport systems ATPase subunit
VVLVTHEADVAEFASRVVQMRDGRIVSDRTQVPKVANPGDRGAEDAPAP